jgi:spore germination cell wall hydrolase CwlJ-like protein
MYRRPLHRRFTSRCTAFVAHWWSELRFRWHTTDKGPWGVLAAAVAVVALFVFLIQSAIASRVERRNLSCLALNVYFEARGEPLAGQYAVAEVTMNRVASGRYPGTVCGVVYQKNWDVLRKRHVGAFSWTELGRKPAPQGEAWERAWRVAEDVYYRRHDPKLDGALLYHAARIRPSWSVGRTPVARIGKHVFYR